MSEHPALDTPPPAYVAPKQRAALAPPPAPVTPLPRSTTILGRAQSALERLKTAASELLQNVGADVKSGMRTAYKTIHAEMKITHGTHTAFMTHLNSIATKGIEALRQAAADAARDENLFAEWRLVMSVGSLADQEDHREEAEYEKLFPKGP
jgi:ribosomal protein S20